ncbi:Methionine synthase (5-methyltetrahydrofolate--homocysteine methyltransferase) (Methionine synthase, partial [Durusdinium trenchii]
ILEEGFLGNMAQKLVETIIGCKTPSPIEVVEHLNTVLRSRICLLDGRMERPIEAANLQEEDYRGGLFKEYLMAGSDLIKTNTVNGAMLPQSMYDMGQRTRDLVYEMNKRGAEVAKRAAAEITKEQPHKPRFVAGAIGVGAGGDEWNQVAVYQQQVQGLLDGGADMLLIESIHNSAACKAAMAAIEQRCRQTNRDTPPIILCTCFDSAGRNLADESIDEFLTSMRRDSCNWAFAIGINCADGAEAHYRQLSQESHCWSQLAAYAEDVEGFCQIVAATSEGVGINFVGGHGTPPCHIEALYKSIEKFSVRELAASPKIVSKAFPTAKTFIIPASTLSDDTVANALGSSLWSDIGPL